MKIYIDKQGISHEETIEFDNSDRDKKVKKWFKKGLANSNPTKKGVDEK